MDSDFSANTPLIVVIDDVEANRYVVRRHLEREGYRVLEAANGTDGLRLAQQMPDLILLDVQMPDISGYEVCNRLKANPRLRSIPVIQTSAAYGRAEDHLRGGEGGADAYLVTPAEPLVLLSTVKVWLRVRKREADQQKAEAIARELQERLKLALDSASLASWEMNLKTGEMFVSAEGQVLLGLPRPEDKPVPGRHTVKFNVHPDDRASEEQTVAAAVRDHTTYRSEFRIIRPDGATRWLLSRGQPTYDESGASLSMSGVMLDNTDRKEAALEVELQRERLLNGFLQSPVAICIWTGPEHTVTLVNRPYLALIGNRDVLGKTLKQAFPELVGQEFAKIVERVYATGERYVDPEFFARVTKGEGLIEDGYYSVVYEPILGSDGKIEAVQNIAMEVTDQVRARNLILENENRFQEISDAMPQIVFTATANGEIDWRNKRWHDYIGHLYHGNEQDQGNPMHPDDVAATRESWNRCMKTGETFQREYRLLRGSDHTYRWHLGRAVPIRSVDGEIVQWIGSNTDIHEHTLLVNRLEEEREMRERFVAALSHDLRTPITAAKLVAELMPRKAHDAEAMKLSSAKIVKCMARADRMIRDLLDANRIKAGEGIPISPEDCRIDEVLNSVIHDLSEMHGPRFKLFNEAGFVAARWDCVAMHRVFENLAGNAIKYGRESTLVTFTITRGPDWAEVAVHNEGDGIAKEDQETLFHPYRRTREADQGVQKGWGIGLTLVKGITEAHGGTVRVESDSIRGTTFFVRLPLTASSVLPSAS